jgi:hypothetical protein
VGDFNGDHILDLAVTNANGGNVSVLLGAGDGTFQPPINTPSFGEPVAIVAGDFNHDGKLDIAVANTIYGGIDILLGNGDGTFQAPVAYTTALNPNSVVSADFNGDGVLDLAVANAGYIFDPGTTVSVLIGKGDGTFASAANYTVGLQPFSVTSADFNGDGTADLAVANYASGTYSVLLGRGNGTFQKPKDYFVGENPFAIRAIHPAGQRTPWLALSAGAGTMLLAGQGNGSFKLAATYDPTALVINEGDFNGDGRPDLALIAKTGLAILFGLDNARYYASKDRSLPAPGNVAVGDFNEDGFLDLATSGGQILLGDGHGGFGSPISLGGVSAESAGGTAGGRVIAADFNHDGHLDLAITTHGLAVYLGNGDGTFRGPVNYPAGPYPEWATAGDFNSDGNVDLAVIDSEKSRVAILLGNGDGSFQKPIYFAAGEATSSAAVGDFNGDGIPDLAVTHNIGGATGWGGVRILLGVGDGTFVKGQDFNAGQTPNAILVGDFNGDGKLDLATANAGGSMSILRGHGDGTFAAPVNYPTYGQTTVSIAAGDLNGDGITDIVLGNLDSANLVVYLGQAGGTFGLEGVYVTLTDPDGLAIANLVNCGLPDLVIASSVEDISVMANTLAP